MEKGGALTGVHGSLAQLLEALEAVDLPQVGQVEQPLDVDHLVLLDLELLDQELAQVAVDRGVHLQPHDLAEAALAQLVLHRAQQVVGLVGDLEVGVAGHAEEGVAQQLHPGEQRVEVARDHGLERHEGVLAEVDEARQHLLGHLHAREQLGVGHRVAQPDARCSATGSRCRGTGRPGPDGQRA